MAGVERRGSERAITDAWSEEGSRERSFDDRTALLAHTRRQKRKPRNAIHAAPCALKPKPNFKWSSSKFAPPTKWPAGAFMP